jgi:hypothetical protein
MDRTSSERLSSCPNASLASGRDANTTLTKSWLNSPQLKAFAAPLLP